MIWFVQGSSVQQCVVSVKQLADLSFSVAVPSFEEVAQCMAEEYIRRHKLKAVVEYGVVGSTDTQYPTYSVVSTDPMFQGVICRFVITDDDNPPVGVAGGLSAPPTVRPDLQS